jgi:hypothetical protein
MAARARARQRAKARAREVSSAVVGQGAAAQGRLVEILPSALLAAVLEQTSVTYGGGGDGGGGGHTKAQHDAMLGVDERAGGAGLSAAAADAAGLSVESHSHASKTRPMALWFKDDKVCSRGAGGGVEVGGRVRRIAAGAGGWGWGWGWGWVRWGARHGSAAAVLRQCCAGAAPMPLRAMPTPAAGRLCYRRNANSPPHSPYPTHPPTPPSITHPPTPHTSSGG